MTRLLLVAVGLTTQLALAEAQTAGGAGAQPRDQATLVRCAPNVSAACLTTSVWLTPAAIRLRGDRTAAGAWRAAFRGDTAIQVLAQRTGLADSSRQAKVLVLVDVSGSMRSDFRFVNTKSALRYFVRALDSLPKGSVSIAVTPFGSHGVRAGIQSARFGSPGAAAGLVDAIPAPNPSENTALYAAVQAGIDRLRAEVAAGGGAGALHLVVITDGVDDVRKGDDPDLLAKPTTRQAAAEAVDQSGGTVSIIGIGSTLDETALRTLAGQQGRVSVVPDAQFELTRRLSEVGQLLAASWDLTVPLSRSAGELGLGYATLGTRFVVGGASADLGTAVWLPPLIAIPAFEGSLPSGVVPEAGLNAPRIDGRWLLAAMLLVVAILAWMLMPRWLWPPIGQAAAKPAKAEAPSPAGLRLDVTEVPPRRPSDVTASKGRKA